METIKRSKLAKRILISMMTVILIISFIISMKQIKDGNLISANQELLRAMTYEQFEDGDEKVEGTDNVEFSAFFLRDIDNDGYADKLKGTCKKVGKEDTLYMELNVLTEGKLKDGKIELSGDNFYLQTTLPKDNEIKNNYIGNNIKEIELNDIENGTQKMLIGIVHSGDYSLGNSNKFAALKNNSNNYSKVNKVVLTGTYIIQEDEEIIEEIEIRKEINLQIDWYGTAVAAFARTSQNFSNTGIANSERNEVNLPFSIELRENINELLLKDAYVEAEIPLLNGYEPTKVIVNGTNSEYFYNDNTRKLTIEKKAEIDDDGNIIKNAYSSYYANSESRYNGFNVEVTYPLEAYESMGEGATIEIKVPVTGYYNGYNNPNTEFNNPYKTNIASATYTIRYQKPAEQVSKFYVDIGKYMHKPSPRYVISKVKPLRIYNELSSEEKDDIYEVSWKASTGTNGEYSGITMKETPNNQEQVIDQFIKSDSSSVNMENITTNIGVYFSNATSMLGDDGWIKVYDDETDNLLVTFGKNEWSNYSRVNPYYFDVPVKHIRIETSSTNALSTFTAYFVKELDDEYITENYTKEQFDEFIRIKTNLVGYMGNTQISTVYDTANYEEPFAVATISISNNTISTQSTERNEIITIEAEKDDNYNIVGWVNGIFLIKMPENISDLKINSISINNANVRILTYEQFEENGEQFIKIITSNDTEQEFSILINCDITPDPRITSETKDIELYAISDEVGEYYYSSQDIYDINGNSNTNELINKRTTPISLISPNSLLTNQTAHNYDDEGTIVIAPKVAILDKERRFATVSVEIKNNYTSTISEVVVLGRVPTEGNKYVINGKEMGSDYSTTMTDAGISIPPELENVAVVYYSENGEATKDLYLESNGWTTEVDDFSKVRSYLIVLDNYALAIGESHVVSYEINIPEGLSYNQVSYSHHAVFFSLDTEQGKYRTQTEPNKIGFMIAAQYDLEVVKYQTNTNKRLSDITFSIQEEGEEEARTRVTGLDGSFKINGLYLDRVYTIKEIVGNSNYELNDEEIKFRGVENNSVLSVELLDGNPKSIIPIQAQEDMDYKIQVNVEDEVRAKLKINKKEKNTENNISRVKYKVTGKGLPTNGRIITTNINGEANISGLFVGEEYVLEETRAEGYYLNTPIHFVIQNNEGEYTANIIDGEIKTQNTTLNDYIPTINLVLEDEKIPKYNLEISKIKHVTNVETGGNPGNTGNEEVTYLEGAKFKLYKAGKEIGSYTSDANGKIVIEDLYAYEEGKDVDQTYVLKEVVTPDGYAKVKDIKFRVSKIFDTFIFEETLEDGQSYKDYTVEDNVIKLIVEDNPSFKLTKKDAETDEVLANIKFAIYNVDDGTVPARNSKGEIIGEREIIDGREYYTITTDANGELTADLPEGFYKAVEVEAPEKYDLSNNEYYFGIGVSNALYNTTSVASAKTFGGIGNDYIKSMAYTNDDGYIVAGDFTDSIYVDGEYYESKGQTDGFIIKYSSEDEVEWVNIVGGTETDNLIKVIQTNDDGYLVLGVYESPRIDIGDTSIINKGSTDSFILKYNSGGDIEWAYNFGADGSDYIKTISELDDGTILIAGYFSKYSVSTYVINGITYPVRDYTEGIIVKLDSFGDYLDSSIISGIGGDCLYTSVSTSDGGFIVGGKIGKEQEICGVSIDNADDGVIIKYNRSLEPEWIKIIDSTINATVYDIVEYIEGGFIVSGSFHGTISTNIGNISSGSSTFNSDAFIIAYDSNFNERFIRKIGKDAEYATTIRSIVAKENGNIGFIGVSTLTWSTVYYNLQVDNFTIPTDRFFVELNSKGVAVNAKGLKNSELYEIVSKNNNYQIVGGISSSSIGFDEELPTSIIGGYDACIIGIEGIEYQPVKYKAGMRYGGEYDDQISAIEKCNDGGFFIIGNYKSNITIGNHYLENSGNTDAYIVKYSSNEEVEWVSTITGSSNENLISITKTNDGGCVLGGYFSAKFSINGEIIGSNNSNHYYLIKLDALGNYVCNYRLDYNYSPKALEETSNGNIIVCVNQTNGDYNCGVYCLNSDLTLLYNNTFGGNSKDYINQSIETEDGGEVLVGQFSQYSNEEFSVSGTSCGFIIKTAANGDFETIKLINGTETETINRIIKQEDGYIVIGIFDSSKLTIDENLSLTRKGSDRNLFIVKYDKSLKALWGKNYIFAKGNSKFGVTGSAESNDGGFYVIGESTASIYMEKYMVKNYGETDGIYLKFNDYGELEFVSTFGSTQQDGFCGIIELSSGTCMLAGNYKNNIDIDGVHLTSEGTRNGFLVKAGVAGGGTEVQELHLYNNVKRFIVRTSVQKIDGIKGGSISGEFDTPYETIQYGGNSTKEIKMIPDENYEIIGITVNGNEWPFEANVDGTYTMPQFENMTEDKNVVVTYSLKDNKITINKVDKNTKEPIANTQFKLDQLEERTEPFVDDIVGDLIGNGADYTMPDTDIDVSEAIGEIVTSGRKYATIDPSGEITGKVGAKQDVGTYYFVENEGIFTSNNNGVNNSVSNSYFPIDLTDLTGTYAVVVNAKISSEGSDYGYATIRESTEPPLYNNAEGQFVKISGTSGGDSFNDYTSYGLEGGKIYYLHLGYRKDNSISNGDDRFTISSIKLYKATYEQYGFIENESKYESNNQGVSNTVANSYTKIDLSDKEGEFALVVNAEISSQINYDIGYATITQSPDIVNQNQSNGRLINISGSQSAKDYKTILTGGQVYYLHFGYQKDSSMDAGEDKFIINSVKLYKAKHCIYNFFDNETGAYVSTNQGEHNTTCNSYIPIDLRGYSGKYNLTLNTSISSQSGYDIGYATVTETTDRVSSGNTNGRFVYVWGNASNQENTTVLNGGKMYYLHLGYSKNESNNTGDDVFTINSIDITLNDSELYHTTVTTNSLGQAITQIPFGKYQITETSTINGYVPVEIPTILDQEGNVISNQGIVEFRSTEGNLHEFTIENEKYGHVTVHHYLKGTTTSVADDEYLEGIQGENYTTLPKVGLSNYELEEIDGEIVLPSNQNGQYTYDDIEVIYYYVQKKVVLKVKHFIDGTMIHVPLKDGTTAEELISYGEINQPYTTSAISNNLLDDEYELVAIPDNSVGTYSGTEIDVTYYYKRIERELIINKTDSTGTEHLSGAQFRIIDHQSDIFGDMTRNGRNYTTRTYDNMYNMNYLLGDLTNNGDYYFVNDNGKLVPNNSKKWQIEHVEGATEGVHNTTANSYMKIDLSGITGNYLAIINAHVSSQSGSDYGYATINTSPSAPAYNDLSGNNNRMMIVSGNSTIPQDKDYESKVLQGGNIYYLHLGYRKDATTDIGDDQIVINSINLYPCNEVTANYYFKYVDGKYISNNSFKDNTVANSYLPIDLREKQGDYVLTVNAQISCASYDYGYATVSQSTSAPSYNTNNSSDTRFIFIYGNQQAEDYSTTLQGGKLYYLHLGYYKNSSNSSGSDSFTINSIKLGDEEYSGRIVETDSNGRVSTLLNVGDYEITEIQAPNGYDLNPIVNTISVTRDSSSQVLNITNEKTKGKVIVHHYIEGTATPVPMADGTDALDVIKEDYVGKMYATEPLPDALIDNRYEFGITPDNSSGIYSENDINVIYYYKEVRREVVINKTDATGTQPLSDAYFKLKKQGDIFGVLTPNGNKYDEVFLTNTSNNYNQYLGNITANNEYYFVDDGNGNYVPTNGKTWQLNNSGSTGIQSKTANSYITIDLSELFGTYAICINASASSEFNNDIGYATITQSQTAPAYNSTSGRFMYISGNQNSADFNSNLLEGGKKYYLHLGYRKDGSVDKDEDQIVINSINLYCASMIEKDYCFINSNGKIISNNQNKNKTVANSYLPIDLRGKDGEIELTVNASVSSESSDYGYATITQSQIAPAYNINSTTERRFIYINGTQLARDYKITLDGGELYYLHLGYYKNEAYFSGEDTFTINSIKIGNEDYVERIVGTDNNGVGITYPNVGSYTITEIQAPSGYDINPTTNTITVTRDSGSQSITVTNERTMGTVNVHYYIVGTTTSVPLKEGGVAEDVIKHDYVGESYTTEAIPNNLIDDRYELCGIPGNSLGIYSENEMDVIYYYKAVERELTINKTDAIGTEQLSNAVFKIKEQGDHFGLLTPNGNKTREAVIIDSSNNSNQYLGEITSNNEYYFVDDGNGNYIPTNGKTWQLNNGGSAGIQNKTANSYIPIDLTDVNGTYLVSINARISSESNCDFGYATITQSQTAPAYTSGSGRFMYITGNQSSNDYVSNKLEGGKKYYLHLGYRKDGSADSNEDQVVINSINLYSAIEIEKEYYFIYDNGKIISNNKNRDNTVANSYLPIDLRGIDGEVELIVNAGTSCASGDIGYATISQSQVAPAYNVNTETERRFIYSNGNQSARDYTITLTGGELYYLHLGYYKNATGSSGNDRFTINSIKIGDENYLNRIVETNSNGIGTTYLNVGNYEVYEVQAPNRYDVNPTVNNITVTRDSGAQSITVTDEKTKGKVIVHHYIDGTTTPVPMEDGTDAADVILQDILGEPYVTEPLDGVSHLFENVGSVGYTSGTYLDGTIEVTYYYDYKDSTVTVHHYIEGTTTSLSDDVTITGKITTSYQTSAATDIPEYYELVAEPSNKNGEITFDPITVIYEYKLKKYPYIVNYYKVGTTDKLNESKNGENRTYGTKVLASDEEISIYGYKVVGHSIDELTIGMENNIINIYYDVDETQRKDLYYYVEYYKDNTIVDGDTVERTTNVQVLQPDTLEIDRTLINNNNKYNGYRLDHTDPSTVPDIVNDGDVIKVYYVKRNDLSYTIHYKEQDSNNTLHEDKVVPNQTFADSVEESAINIPGYDKVEPTTTNIEITTGINEYTFYYKKAKYNYIVEYYYNDVKDETLTDTIEATYLDKITTYTDKVKLGYMFDKTKGLPLTISYDEDDNLIKVYYKTDPDQRKDLYYTVEYYKDNVLVEGDTITKSRNVQILEPDTITIDRSLINNNNKYDGYKLSNTDPSIVPDIVNDGDVIKVYYTKRTDLSYTIHYKEQGTNKTIAEDKIVGNQVFGSTANESAIEIDGYLKLDPTSAEIEITAGLNEYTFFYNRTKFNYTVEYYYNEVLDDSKTDTIEATYLDEITTYTDKAVTGYTFDKVEGTPLVISTNEDENLIKVFYKIDENQRKDLHYTVVYFKDNILVPEDTVHRSESVQVLEEDTIEVDRSLFTDENKYYGYKINTTKPSTIPGRVPDETIIHVFYIPDETMRKDVKYTVEYYKDGILTDTDVETGSVQILQPDTIEVNKERINTTDKYENYVLDYTDPEVIPDVVESNSVIKIYYVRRNDLRYVVHYKDEITGKSLADDKVVTNQTFGDKVQESAIDIVGYDKVDPTNAEIEITSGTNEYTFYYNRAKFNYTVEYYYDNVIDDSKTDEIESLYHEDITTYTDKVKEGYKLDKVEGIPLTISENEDKNIIKVYYVIDPSQTKTIQYIVNYYKDNVLQEADTQYQTQEVQLLSDEELIVDKSAINTTNKYEDYTFVETDPTQIPDTIKNGGVIDVYYTRNKYPYSIEYYYNNIIDVEATESGQGYKGDIIDTYTNKNKDGYEFESVEGLPLIISSTEDNIIKVYYLPIRKITINHIDKNSNEIIKTEEKTGKEGYTVKTSAEDFEGYVLLEKPEIEEYTYSENEQIVNYYYAKISSGVIEKQIDIISGKPLVEDILHEGYAGKAYSTQIKNIDNYEHATNKQYYKMLLETNPNLLIDAGVSTLEEYLESKGIDENLDYIPANSKGNMTDDLIEVRYYYVPKTKLIVKYVDINTGEEITEEIDGNIVSTTIEKDGVVDEAYSTTQKEFDDYIVISYKIYYKNYFKNHPDELKEDSIDEYMSNNNIDPDALYTPSNSEGTMLLINNPDGTYSNETIVTYYYGRKREVVVKYYDYNTNEEISEEIVKIGPDGEPYSVEDTKKEIENYTLLEEPDNPTGIYQENNETRKYYYAKNTQVVVKYVDKATGKELTTTKTIDGYVGKVYTTEKEDIDGYNYISSTNNTSGQMTEDILEVVYYYSKPKEKKYSKYTINYIDADTGKPIKESKEIDKQEVETKIYTKSLVIDIDDYTFKNANTDYFVVKENEDNIINLYYSKNETSKEKEPTVVNIKIKDDTPTNNVKNANNEKPTKDQVRVSNTEKSIYIDKILGAAFIFVGCIIIVVNKIHDIRNKRKE